MLLEKAGNWGVVSGSEPNPTTLPVASGAQPPTQDVIDAWLKKDFEARTELVLHMGDRQVQLVRQLNTSKEMWDSLQQQYQQTNVVSRVLLHRKLNEVHHKNYNSTEAFLDAWQQTNDNLMISGLILPREIQVTILLAALPDSWQSFISTQSTNAARTSFVEGVFFPRMHRRRPYLLGHSGSINGANFDRWNLTTGATIDYFKIVHLTEILAGMLHATVLLLQPPKHLALGAIQIAPVVPLQVYPHATSADGVGILNMNVILNGGCKGSLEDRGFPPTWLKSTMIPWTKICPFHNFSLPLLVAPQWG